MLYLHGFRIVRHVLLVLRYYLCVKRIWVLIQVVAVWVRTFFLTLGFFIYTKMKLIGLFQLIILNHLIANSIHIIRTCSRLCRIKSSQHQSKIYTLRQPLCWNGIFIYFFFSLPSSSHYVHKQMCTKQTSIWFIWCGDREVNKKKHNTFVWLNYFNCLDF